MKIADTTKSITAHVLRSKLKGMNGLKIMAIGANINIKNIGAGESSSCDIRTANKHQIKDMPEIMFRSNS